MREEIDLMGWKLGLWIVSHLESLEGGLGVVKRMMDLTGN